MSKLKLSPKQLAAIQGIEQQKQQLTSMLQEANQKQNLVAELAFEAAGIDITTIEGVKLEEDSLVYSEKEKGAKPAKKKSTAVAE